MNRSLSPRLQQLEAITAHLLREVYFTFPKVGMLWSIGKDSTVLLWIARKAFQGRVPFPLIHIDTSFKIPEMIEYRGKVARDWGLELIVGENRAALDAGQSYPAGTLSRIECCRTLKTEPLLKTISGEWATLRYNISSGALEPNLNRSPFSAIFVGLRGDEEGSRSKERYVSPRTIDGAWDISRQPAELWEIFLDSSYSGTSSEHEAQEGKVRCVRAHPLLDWTELDIWEYIEQEQIPVTSLYFDRGEGRRFRSLGCACCTASIQSTAKDAGEILVELRGPLHKVAERSGRAQDAEDGGGLETLRRGGYM